MDDTRAEQAFPYATAVFLAVMIGVAWLVTGFIPTEASLAPLWWSSEHAQDGELHRLVTAMFAHGGLLHLAFNSIALLSLSRLERVIGTPAFAGVFLAAGIGGGIAHVMSSSIPTVGASGAIFGLLGLLLVTAPRTQLSLLFFPVPAIVLLPLYLSAVLLIPGLSEIAPIAHWAHLGGMFVGMAGGVAIAPREGLEHLGYIAIVFGATLVLVATAQELVLDELARTFEQEGLVGVLAATWQAWLALLVIIGTLAWMDQAEARGTER